MRWNKALGNTKHQLEPLEFTQLRLPINVLSQSCLIIIHENENAVALLPDFAIDIRPVRILGIAKFLQYVATGFDEGRIQRDELYCISLA